MKKIILSVFAFALLGVLTANAQEGKKDTLTKPDKLEIKNGCCNMKNGCTMRDGKMMLYKDGKCTLMTKTITMSNGTVCTPQGECIMRDGTKTFIMEGQCCDMQGVIVVAK